VKNGRLTVNEPSDLPDGQVVTLLPIDELLALIDAADGTGPVTFELAPARPAFRAPKAVDAAALLDELRAM
jgi:hypothetical protein